MQGLFSGSAISGAGNPSLLLGIAACFLLAGWVKGVIGMGLPTVAMGLLGLVMSGAEAAALLVLPSLVTNLWQMFNGPGLVSVGRRLWTMQLGVFAGTFAGIGLLTDEPSSIGPVLLGTVLAVYGILGIRSVRFSVKPSAERWLSPAMGVVTGILTGATGVFVVPAVPYVASMDFDKEELIQALGLSFTVSTLALAAALTSKGAFSAPMAGASLLALIPALAGMFLGQWIRSKLQPEAFRKWFFISLLVLGIYMVVRALVANA